jgi:exopolysaccharide production protein ExoZ
MTQKLNSLQVGRGLAALIVLLFHFQSLFAFTHPNSILRTVFRFGSTGVDFFFTLSGFLMMYVHRRDFGKWRGLGDYAMKRVTRIYPVYWVLCAVLVPIALKLPMLMQHENKLNAISLWSSVLLIPHSGGRLLQLTWTLEYEVLFYTAFALFFFSSRVATGVFSGWFLAILGVAMFGPHTLTTVGSPQMGNYFLGFALNLHIAEFMLGMVIAYGTQQGFRLKHPRSALAASIAAGAFFAVYHAYYVPMDSPPLRMGTVGYGLITAAIVTGLVHTELQRTVRFPRWLQELGAASYSIYLTHFLVISSIVVVLKRIPAAQALPAWVLFAIGIPVALLPGFLLHWLVEAPLLTKFVSIRKGKPAAAAMSGQSTTVSTSVS